MKNFLYRITANLPCRLIPRDNGARYLERYYVGRFLGLTFYLHRFVAADADEWVHDHPWSWSLAVLLTGHYDEERLVWFDVNEGWAAKWRRIGGWRRLNVIKGGDFHRIARSRPETWTLFIHQPRCKGWGFLRKTFAGVFYDQPYDVAGSKDWEKTAPVGRDAGRAPLRGVA